MFEHADRPTPSSDSLIAARFAWPKSGTSGIGSSFGTVTHGTGARTLREALSDPSSGGVDFCGTPDSVAAEMGEAIAEIGGDGFMITEGVTRRMIGEIADGLVPALQRRGLVRTRYSHALFRDNLLEF
jgi:alkanesulfonate monooxygenase SsuD/methylene tetrahydromethanopterin reductase-like flavin-dependent oxidoreductase (luciferase family)